VSTEHQLAELHAAIADAVEAIDQQFRLGLIRANRAGGLPPEELLARNIAAARSELVRLARLVDALDALDQGGRRRAPLVPFRDPHDTDQQPSAKPAPAIADQAGEEHHNATEGN
jgi:hypothetical protein